MALKKPSEYFKKNIVTVDAAVQEVVKTPELNTFSDAFESFKNNLSKIEVLSDFAGTLDNYRVNVERVNHLSDNVEDIRTEIQTLLKKEDLDRAMMSQLLVFEQSIRDVQNKVKGINETKLIEIRSDVTDLTDSVNQFFEVEVPQYKKQITESVKDDLTKKITDLEVDIVRNESHLKVQNKNLEQIQEDVRSTLNTLDIKRLEKKSHQLTKKIKYLEGVFEKFSEREILTENIIVQPPSTDNKDPLTPLDQNFVTLDQLQQHYRLFINRIQQQLAAIGGGGETRLEFLDDVDRDSVKVNDKFLKYDSSVGKWVGADAGAQTLNETLGFGNTSSLGMSVGVTTATKLHVDPVGAGFTYSEDLVVQGNARVTGSLSIGTSSIVLDSNTKTIRGVQQIKIDSEQANVKPIVIKQVTEKIIFVKTETNGDGEEVETEQEASVGIGSTASINTTGIVTATSFHGDGSGLTGIVASNIGSTASVNTTGIITASSFFGDGSGLTGIVASGSGVVVQNDGSNVGTASTINFGSDLDATFSGGIATINVSIPLSALTDVNTSNLSGITTDYLMVYDPSVPGFKFVDPKTYFGINNDANPDPTIDDFGSY